MVQNKNKEFTCTGSESIANSYPTTTNLKNFSLYTINILFCLPNYYQFNSTYGKADSFTSHSSYFKAAEYLHIKIINHRKTKLSFQLNSISSQVEDERAHIEKSNMFTVLLYSPDVCGYFCSSYLKTAYFCTGWNVR